MREALKENAWINKIDTSREISIDHMFEYVDLWVLLCQVQLCEDVEGDITWKFSSKGEYSAASACKAIHGSHSHSDEQNSMEGLGTT